MNRHPTNIPLLANSAFWDHTADSWQAFVKGFYVSKDSKSSKRVSDVTITNTGEKWMVRIRRPEKKLTDKEVRLLAEEKAVDYTKLFTILSGKKITIIDDNGEVLNEKQERNAQRKRTARQTKEVPNQLLEFGAPADMHAQGEIQPSGRTAGAK